VSAYGYGYANNQNNTTTPTTPDITPEADGLCDFDKMPIGYQRSAIVDMLNKIPKVGILLMC
jgi:hypothetical protein